MERNTSFAKWVRIPSKNELEEGEQEEEEEEAALSLCDLPLEEDDNNQSRKEAPDQTTRNEDDFDFCSLLKESDQMVAADEVFFQGQILPLRHSLSSSDGGLAASRSNSSHNTSRCISRSESMERSYSSGFTSGSSRSSSIRSHQSSSSSSSSAHTPNHKPRVRNHFHYSHPSPRPQIKISNLRNNQLSNSNQKHSTIWSHFRLGLLTPPEIELQDLKSRSSNINNNKAFAGSRNSTGSNVSNTRANKKQKQLGGIFFDKNGALFGGCKCTVDAVAEAVPSRVVTIRRNASEKEAYSHDQEVDQLAAKGTKQQRQEGKQALSRHRTFEWLKQLSLEGQSAAADDDEA